jgi:hypothetical protein
MLFRNIMVIIFGGFIFLSENFAKNQKTELAEFLNNSQLINNTNDTLSNIIQQIRISPLPLGENCILSFTKPITITPGETNDHLTDSMYALNRYYSFETQKTHIRIHLPIKKNADELHYYDIEVISPNIRVIDSLTFILNRLPDLEDYYIFYCKQPINSLSKGYVELYNLYTFNKVQHKIVDGLNIFYKQNLFYGKKIAVYKDFTDGFVEKFFYIKNDGIISLYYFDYIVMGEGEDFKFLKKEDWKIKPNGKFARYYKANGYFKDDEEKGQVKNHLREGQWVETKPNGMVNKLTYLEASFKEGEPTGLWKFYSFEASKKGKLLYTESYKDGELEKREFSDK